MCLLVYMSEYTTAPVERLYNASINNPDGFGWAIVDKHKIVKGHGMDIDAVVDDFLTARAKHPGDALFHLRWATHGVTDVNNCHPFTVGSDNLSVLAHNGVLPVDVPKGEKRSDTRIFAEDWLPEFGGVPALDDKQFFNEVSAFTRGSKLVVLTANPDTKYWSYIVNEQDGDWEDGVWWSNDSYIVRPRVSYGYSSSYEAYGADKYSAGWDGLDDLGEHPVWRCAQCWNTMEVDPYDNDWDGYCDLCNACMYCGDDPCVCPAMSDAMIEQLEGAK
jgi:hypothetical protein